VTDCGALNQSPISNPQSPTQIHVVAAVLRDARGRILLTRRTADRDLAGLWEFPGGKVDAGETPEQALARELDEELGIAIGPSEPLIAVPHAYAHKRILLDVRVAASFVGRARGRESQALAWVAPEKLASYAMPAADRPVLAALRQPDRYLITPEPGDDDGEFLGALTRALDAGVRRVQLRIKSVRGARARSLSDTVRCLVSAAGAELLVNADNEDALARSEALGAGLHLTAPQLRTLHDRPIEARRALAASCHDGEDLRRAEAIGCDFVVLGPVQPTASHPGAPALGWSAFAALREAVAMPIYALGGLGPPDLPLARAHGAQGVAAIRSLWPAAR
jgi:8-oxo-dGTP diphosphatase